jgi:Asp-tRNA(Asn)/Glu-tRNA(Gln) amidotransferase A subunit family amidase
MEVIMSVYDLKSVKLPVLSGVKLELFTALLGNPLTHALLINPLLKNSGVTWLRSQAFNLTPTFYPLARVENPAQSTAELPGEDAIKDNQPRPKTPYASIRDYAAAYRQGHTTPLEVAEKLLAAIESSDQGDTPLRSIIQIDRQDVLSQARAATERIQTGKALSILDGVPVPVKDEFDMMPYSTSGGTTFLGQKPAAADATIVARLRAAGALLPGKAAMNEIGINTEGLNQHYGRTCNPWDLNYDPGGSSSGPAAAVAAGFGPVSLGADGGGSIRIPAAHCGLVGLKPTFGRFSEHGALPLCWTVAHAGPIGVSVEDVALAYQVMAGPDPADPLSQAQPEVTVDGWNNPDLTGMRLGIYWDWFRHADSEVVAANETMLGQLIDAGAQLVEVEIPFLNAQRVAQAVSILSEMYAFLSAYPKQLKKLAAMTRINLMLGQVVSGNDVLKSQRVRTAAIAAWKDVMTQVDAVITPATALPPQEVPLEVRKKGRNDLSVVTEMMRYAFPGNFTGLPAISFPAGYTENELPVGMQAIGSYWQEDTLLRIAYTAEQAFERRLPPLHYALL